jgi:filamentous hemagglutinin family protein
MNHSKLYPQQQISIGNIATASTAKLLVRSIFTIGVCAGFIIPASAQVTAGGDGTVVNQTNGTFNITGGAPSASGTNLFHSFGEFGLNTNQVANFVQPNASVQNILGRVTGGAPSSIDGKIQVTGGNANLYLMNPAGIVFGKNASLDINGAFTATTAKAIDFGNGNWFNALGTNTYGNLNDNPIGFAFPGSTPGSIFSTANLTTKPGQSITLVGGTVINTGTIKTDGGNISIATVDGGKYVQIKADGSILRVDLPISANNINAETKSFTALSLSELLTATKPDLVATGVKNENGVVTLVGNPEADALLPVLDKAKVDYQKALAAQNKAEAAEEKPRADYFNALRAVGGNSALVEKGIIDAYNNAKSVLEDSKRITDDLFTSIQNTQKAFDERSTSSVFGQPSLISDAISRGDTVSRQNRPIVSGDIIVKKLDTSARDVKGGNVYLDSSRAILIGDINTRRFNSSSEYVTGELNSYGGKVVLNAQTEIVAGIINSGTSPLQDPKNRFAYLPTAGGDVTLSTQTGDIIVESIGTSSGQDFQGNLDLKSLTVRGGDLTVNAKGLFRVITKTSGNSRNNTSINASPFGKIDIKHGGTSFVTGASEEDLSEVTLSQPGRKITEGFEFLPGQSGARGFIITSFLGNGSYAVVYTNGRGFYDFQSSREGANGSSITAVPRTTTPPEKPTEKPTEKPKNNSDSQASRQKSKQDCTPNSTSVAANPTSDPTRAAGTSSASSADPCQTITGSASSILQILTNRN